MVKNILLGFASLALAVASAASSYNVTFYEPVMINGSELKAGDYKLELKEQDRRHQAGQNRDRSAGDSRERQSEISTNRRPPERHAGGRDPHRRHQHAVVFDKTSNATN